MSTSSGLRPIEDILVVGVAARGTEATPESMVLIAVEVGGGEGGRGMRTKCGAGKYDVDGVAAGTEEARLERVVDVVKYGCCECYCYPFLVKINSEKTLCGPTFDLVHHGA
jgi:hypothetical protein